MQPLISTLGAVAQLGRATRHRTHQALDRVRFLGAVAAAAPSLPGSAWPVATRTLVNQLRFTALDALPLLLGIAVALGVMIAVQVLAQAVRFGMVEALGPILVLAVVRELGPLLTAVVVIGRSGTAIAAELATARVLGEVRALELAGVDPRQFHVLPRVAGGALSMALLTINFVVATLATGVIAVTLIADISPTSLVESLRLALRPSDLVLMVGKSVIFGAGIALLCCYEGLKVGTQSTEVPQAVTRGVVASLLFVFAVSAVITAAVYL